MVRHDYNASIISHDLQREVTSRFFFIFLHMDILYHTVSLLYEAASHYQGLHTDILYHTVSLLYEAVSHYQGPHTDIHTVSSLYEAA